MMLKQFFTAITGISEDIDSDENQEAWDRRQFLDENDLDDDCDLDDETGDEPENVKQWLGWFGL